MKTLLILLLALAGLFLVFLIVCLRSPRGEEDKAGFHPAPPEPAEPTLRKDPLLSLQKPKP